MPVLEQKRTKLQAEYDELLEIKQALEKLYAEMKAELEAKIQALINQREVGNRNQSLKKHTPPYTCLIRSRLRSTTNTGRPMSKSSRPP